MATLDEVQAAMTRAMKARDQLRTATLRLLYSELKKAVIDGGHPLGEDEVADVVRKQIRQRREAIEQYEKGARPELAEKERRELAILEELQPAQLSADEIEAEVRRIVEELKLAGPRALGAVMGEMMKRHRGRVDGGRVREVASRVLGAG